MIRLMMLLSVLGLSAALSHAEWLQYDPTPARMHVTGPPRSTNTFPPAGTRAVVEYPGAVTWPAPAGCTGRWEWTRISDLAQVQAGNPAGLSVREDVTLFRSTSTFLEGCHEVTGRTDLTAVFAETLIAEVAKYRLAMALNEIQTVVRELVLVAVGAQVVYLVTVFYIAIKLERASALYGGLGVAATFLFVLWIFGRLVISSAILNAELWRRKEHAAGPGSPG